MIDLIALALGLGGEIGDQARQQADHFVEQLMQRRRRFDAVFQYAVEQVFHGPGQFAQHQGTDHAPAALEGVEGAAQLAQGRSVGGVGVPLREKVMEHFEDFVGFFEEHLMQLLVHRRFARGRRQQAAGGVPRGRVEA